VGTAKSEVIVLIHMMVHVPVHIQGSSQGILAYWAGIVQRLGPGAPPACMKLKKIISSFFMFYACISSKHAEMLSNMLLLPFY
jgi:hypothetical protein